MNDNSRPADLLIEVKCSRLNRFSIKQRDLDGLTSNSAHGYLAALVTSDLQAGPHWTFIPIHKITPRTYPGRTLMAYSERNECFDTLDRLWGDVLMDDELMDKLIDMQVDLKSREWWQKLPFQRRAAAHDAVRKIKVAEALERMRTRLNEKYKRGASRKEGFLHQCILCFCLNKSGHKTISNNSGVPDLRTQLSGTI